jgi:hypothetical protein
VDARVRAQDEVGHLVFTETLATAPQGP